MPLVRFGLLHMYNNLTTGSTTTSDPDQKFESGLDVRYQSDVISENNFYEFTGLRPKEVCGKVAGGKTTAISFRSSGQRFINDKDDDGKSVTATIDVQFQGGSVAAARAGIVAITDGTAISPYAWTARYASTGEIRAAINGDGKAAISGYSTSTPPVWVRIWRAGNALYSGASTDGVTWAELKD